MAGAGRSVDKTRTLTSKCAEPGPRSEQAGLLFHGTSDSEDVAREPEPSRPGYENRHAYAREEDKHHGVLISRV